MPIDQNAIRWDEAPQATGKLMVNPNTVQWDSAPSQMTAAPPQRSFMQDMSRTATMTGRNLVQGALGIPGLIHDSLIEKPFNAISAAVGSDARLAPASDQLDQMMNHVVSNPQPENGVERVEQGVTRGLGGLATGMGVGAALEGAGGTVASNVGRMLTSRPMAQVAATTAGSTSGELAHEGGFSVPVQFAASLVGGASPLALEGGAAALAGTARTALGKVSPEALALAQQAKAEGIPIKASQLSDSRVAKTLDSVTSQVPLSGARNFQNQQQGAFNRAVGRTIGADGDKITPQVFAEAKQRIGAEYDRLTSQNSILLDTQLSDRMRQIQQDTQMGFGHQAQKTVDDTISRIMAQGQHGAIPGHTYQSIDSQLARAAAAGGEASIPIGDMRSALRDAMSRNITPEDAAAWAKANAQYRDLKTIEPLVAEASSNGGNISAAKLMGRVTANKAGKASVATGRRGDLGDLAQMGQRFLKQQIPDSGTASRNATFDYLKKIGPVVGSAIGTGVAINPFAGALSLAGAMGGSRMVQAVMKNPRLLDAMMQSPRQSRLPALLGSSINPVQSSELQQRQ